MQTNELFPSHGLTATDNMDFQLSISANACVCVCVRSLSEFDTFWLLLRTCELNLKIFSRECRRTFDCCCFWRAHNLLHICSAIAKNNIQCVRFFSLWFSSRLHKLLFEWNCVRFFSYHTLIPTNTYAYRHSSESKQRKTLMFILVLMRNHNGIPI